MTKKTLTKKIDSVTRPPARRGAAAKSSLVEASRPGAEDTGGQWTFLTNHAHVLILLAQNPSIVLRKVAEFVRITERAVQKIIADLEEAGFIEREKVGRQNRYRIRREQRLRHTVEGHRTIGDLLRIVDNAR
jgi:DNA-binding MarR family transcriptional regulator